MINTWRVGKRDEERGRKKERKEMRENEWEREKYF